MESFPDIIELNVGGVFYTTSLATLTNEPDSLLGEIFTGKSQNPLSKDSKGKYFLDRDGVLFRYVLDFLRNKKLVLPENFHEKERLRSEADYFRLLGMVSCVEEAIANLKITNGNKDGVVCNVNAYVHGQKGSAGCISLGYRGTFAFGRDGLADVKFRKLSRILVAGRVQLCREAFGDQLNESRDPDRGTSDRYTSRYFLKHVFLEQAFDSLYEAGFKLVGVCGSGTNSMGELKPGMESEESKWNHYNEFVFWRDAANAQPPTTPLLDSTNASS